MDPKELFKEVFRGKRVEPPLFIPLVFGLAARVAQISLPQMLGDPTRLANSLNLTQQLFGYDVIINTLDPTLESEAAGCRIKWGKEEGVPVVVSHPWEEEPANNFSLDDWEKRGRLPIVLEATKRLVLTPGRKAAVLGVITGPLTIACNLRGEALKDDLRDSLNLAAQPAALRRAGELVLRLAKLYCELKVEGILIYEPNLTLLTAGQLSYLRSLLTPVWNVARFYNLHAVLCAPNYTEYANLFNLKADALVINIDHAEESFLHLWAKSGQVVVGALSADELFSPYQQIMAKLERLLAVGSRGCFMVGSAEEVPYNVPIEVLHEIKKFLKMAGKAS